MLDITDASVDEVKRFTKSGFDLEQNINAATELKYTKEIKRILSEEMADPSDELVRLFAGKIYTGKLTTAVRQQFADITKRALHQFVSDRVSDRLKSALADESASSRDSKPSVPETVIAETHLAQDRDKQIVTTELELEGFYIVKSILRETTDGGRIVHRDQRSYFGILLDNNNRKPICRLHFSVSRKQLGLFDKDKQEERVLLETLDDIYKYGDRLKATVAFYDSSKP